MRPGFQIYLDARGDLFVEDGVLIDKATGTVYPVGSGDAAGAEKLVGQVAVNLTIAEPIPNAESATLVGGSGANVIVSGLAGLDGIYRPGRPGFWSCGIFVIEVTGASAATLSDGVDVVAALTTGGAAPIGEYVATSHGEDTYNASAAFTLAGDEEGGWPGAVADLDVAVSGGTAQGGVYEATDAVTFVSTVDADWVITVNSDGTAELAYDGTVVAERSEGPADDPCGVYESTEDGLTLNPEFPEGEEAAEELTNPFGLLELTFNWSGAPDLDIGVTFLGETVGFDYGSSTDYLAWGGDNVSDGGPETVDVDLAAAWDAGEISTVADVLALADWYPPAGGSGPATLTVVYDGGAPVDYLLHPGQATPATNPALAIRILADGTVSIVGEDWRATVQARRRAPIAGVVYLTVTEAGGEVDSVAGPFFAATLPSPSAGEVHYPLATSDGSGGLKQLHIGPLFWSAKQAAESIAWGTVADSTDPGEQGQVKMDGTYLYGCVATDTWGRIPWVLTAWP